MIPNVTWVHKFDLKISNLKSWTKTKTENTSKYHIDINMLPFPPWYNVVNTSWLSTCVLFPRLAFGEVDWKQGTGNYITHFRENWEYIIVLIRLLVFDFANFYDICSCLLICAQDCTGKGKLIKEDI